MKKIFVFLMVMIVAGVAAIYFTKVPTASVQNVGLTNSNLRFSAKECDKNIDAYNPENLGVKETNWVGDSLKIKAYVSINCGEEIEGGAFQSAGSQLSLEYQVNKCSGNDCLKCMCARELNYEIKDLAKGDYTYEMVRVDK